ALCGGPGRPPLMARLWDTMGGTRFEPGEELACLNAPFEKDTVFAGPAVADLYVASDASDVHVQVSVSEVRPAGTEYLVQNGWLDIGHRAEDLRRSDGLEVVHRFTEDAYEPL